MFHVVFYQPEIPQNTGNTGRTCAMTGTRLHLIKPLGFQIRDKHLKRSGMDYWAALDWHLHEDWESFLASEHGPKRLWLLTTRAERSYWDVEYEDGDGFLFGNEGHGAPPEIHAWAGERRLQIPKINPELRSLNLSSAAAVVVYEAVRQRSFSSK